MDGHASERLGERQELIENVQGEVAVDSRAGAGFEAINQWRATDIEKDLRYLSPIARIQGSRECCMLLGDLPPHVVATLSCATRAGLRLDAVKIVNQSLNDQVVIWARRVLPRRETIGDLQLREIMKEQSLVATAEVTGALAQGLQSMPQLHFKLHAKAAGHVLPFGSAALNPVQATFIFPQAGLNVKGEWNGSPARPSDRIGADRGGDYWNGGGRCLSGHPGG